MASCKECIHFDRCKGLYKFDRLQKAVSKGCSYFKDRSRFVELPCKVGDTVYVKTLFGDYAEAEVRDYSYFIYCGFCVVVTSTKFDKHHIPFSKFGKTVFLTREEAEQALKKSENNPQFHSAHEGYAVLLEEVEEAKEECELTIGMTVKEAVEKQIPKKVMLSKEYPLYKLCFNCHKNLFSFANGWQYNYCPYCGQRLDWSDNLER